MIANPQIFIFYLPGMFGTLLANCFMHQKLLYHDDIEHLEFDDKEGKNFNTHDGAYKDFLSNFHNKGDTLFKKTNDQLLKFFSPLKKKPIGVHRLCDYKTAGFDFGKYFSQVLYIILLPKNKDHMNVYSERSFYAASNGDVTNDFWYTRFKKDIKQYPKYLIEGLGIKERKKYFTQYYNEMLEVDMKTLKQKNIIYFDPAQMNNIDKIQALVDEACDNLRISKFKLPVSKVHNFIGRNKKWFNKLN